MLPAISALPFHSIPEHAALYHQNLGAALMNLVESFLTNTEALQFVQSALGEFRWRQRPGRPSRKPTTGSDCANSSAAAEVSGASYKLAGESFRRYLQLNLLPAARQNTLSRRDRWSPACRISPLAPNALIRNPETDSGPQHAVLSAEICLDFQLALWRLGHRSICFLHGRLCSLEADFRVCAVTERFTNRPAAPAQ